MRQLDLGPEHMGTDENRDVPYTPFRPGDKVWATCWWLPRGKVRATIEDVRVETTELIAAAGPYPAIYHTVIEHKVRTDDPIHIPYANYGHIGYTGRHRLSEVLKLLDQHYVDLWLGELEPRKR